eukprot:CAMPEP_0198237714 /NCGR_PEP_ID=MMETSP1446-20131203/3509_1 /TAXON_ID=1461542 ORGANISM="Unidentified sp, Strain CCMP2111" /NCGR_SAMPLE_ID=MMETSP1446 /ASSEMBLY_ACC=CAM_ASM_001112 /LENGTH=883 /DNA_ID=CAMNT_0043919949 /DNA_START=128 /DNA_END=2779 /DNA_ORIENTATION=-
MAHFEGVNGGEESSSRLSGSPGHASTSLWRSEEMQFVQLVIPAEAAHDTVARLGHVGLMQFKDLNTDKSAFQRTYANQVKRCDEMQRKLRFLLDEMVKVGIADADAKLQAVTHALADPELLESSYELDELEVTLEELEKDLVSITTAASKLRKSESELVEFQLVLEKAGQFFEDAKRTGASLRGSGGSPREVELSGSHHADESIESPLMGSDFTHARQGAASGYPGLSSRLGFIAGLVPTAKLHQFERVAFRAMRGNVFLKSSPVGPVRDPALDEKVNKDVFVIFFSGDRSRSKMLKICDAFAANRYPLPEEPHRQAQMHSEVCTRLAELSSTSRAGDDQGRALMLRASHHWESWMAATMAEKATYHAMNKFSIDVTSKCLVAQGWIPSASRASIADALRYAAARSNAPVETIFSTVQASAGLRGGGGASDLRNPPTYFRTTKVITAFQGLVDAYGVARYREMNPTVFTIVTFPFLFAVMFGDVGHGLLMLMAGLYMVLNEKKMQKKKLNDIVEMAFGGRYLIVLMSVFSIYTGLLYNEMFSIPMTLFGPTKWVWSSDQDKYVMPAGAAPYAFGVDPIWHGTKTELTFLNSMKMKMSIVLGVIQMLLGVAVSCFNHLQKPTGPQTSERDTLSITCEFVPRLLFLTCTFGYLAILILVKWFTASKADLYLLMINMFLSPGANECGKNCPETDPLYGLGGLAGFLVFVAFCCVPWMLLPKPLIIRKRHALKSQGGHAYGILSAEEDSDGDDENGNAGGGEEDEYNFGEEMVHQMIHTIEYVLGSVSNTASYLRLWALSLAHSQLSSVFYEKCFVAAMETGSPVAIVIGFYVWAMATLGVLMVMESLSAFLHALRLHWVEYQNKFYVGDGYSFEPFAFQTLNTNET